MPQYDLLVPSVWILAACLLVLAARTIERHWARAQSLEARAVAAGLVPDEDRARLLIGGLSIEAALTIRRDYAGRGHPGVGGREARAVGQAWNVLLMARDLGLLDDATRAELYQLVPRDAWEAAGLVVGTPGPIQAHTLLGRDS